MLSFIILVLYGVEFIFVIGFFLELIDRVNPMLSQTSSFYIGLRKMIFSIVHPTIDFIKKNIPTTFKGFDLSYIMIILGIEILKNIILLLFK